MTPTPDSGDVRLYCWAHSGSNVGPFQVWSGRLTGISVFGWERPGRGVQWGKKPISDMNSYIDATVDPLLRDIDGRPFALFGHSVGALIAYEIAQRMYELRRQGALRHLIVSGHWAPHAMSGRKSLVGSTDEELTESALSELKRLNGTPPEMLNHPAARRVLVPPFLADSLIGDSYQFRERVPLEVPITAISATADQQVGVRAMQEWRWHTTAGFGQRILDGDHFAVYRDSKTLLFLQGALNPIPSATQS